MKVTCQTAIATAMPRDENESDMPDRNVAAMPRNTKVTDTQERAVAFVPQSTSATRQTDTEWKKYVVKPGDTFLMFCKAIRIRFWHL